MLAHSINTVPYYRQLNLADSSALQDFPFLDRKTISGCEESFISERYKYDELITKTTSGTTSIPLKLYQHPADTARAAVSLWGARRWHGVRSPREPSCGFYGYEGYRLTETLEPRLIRLNRSDNLLQFNKYDLTSDACAEYWCAMNGHSPRLFQGSPSAIGRLASWMLDNNYSGPESIRLIELNTEVVTAADRNSIASAFPHAALANVYAASEVWVIGYECPRGSLHTMTDNVHVELLNPVSTSGQTTGEIVVTSLVMAAMPIIRYRLGDLITVRTTPCDCGRPGTVIERILGRTNGDHAVTPSGEDIHPYFFTTIVERVNAMFPSAIARFQFVQHDRWMEAKIEQGRGWNPAAQNALAALFSGKFLDMKIEYSFERIEDPVLGKYMAFKRIK
jgi:phenylacetate-CoA ligase